MITTTTTARGLMIGRSVAPDGSTRVQLLDGTTYLIPSPIASMCTFSMGAPIRLSIDEQGIVTSCRTGAGA